MTSRSIHTLYVHVRSVSPLLQAGFYILDQFCCEEVSMSFLNCYCCVIIFEGAAHFPFTISGQSDDEKTDPII